MTNMHNPPHPGEVLRELLADISVTDAARRLGVTRVALSRVLNGSAGISADMDLRLSKALGTTPGSWYAMQANYDMAQAKRHFRAKVRRIRTPQRTPTRLKLAARAERPSHPTRSAPLGLQAVAEHMAIRCPSRGQLVCFNRTESAAA